jgi:hypothetical protein
MEGEKSMAEMAVAQLREKLGQAEGVAPAPEGVLGV